MSRQRFVDQVEASRAILAESQLEIEPYVVDVCGSRFVVLPNVFSPRYFKSTPIFTGCMTVAKSERFLEVGCGAGVTAVAAARRGADVLAVDISAAAVRNAKLNAELHGVEDRLQARESDLFSAVGSDGPFDTISWNAPFIRVEPEYEYRSTLERSLYDPGYRYLRRFLDEGRGHMRVNGRVLVGFGDFGDVIALHAMAVEFSYSIAETASVRSSEKNPVTFLLYELRQVAA